MKQLIFIISCIILLIPENKSTESNNDVIYFTNSGQAEFTSRVPLHSFTGESSHLTGMIDLEEQIVDFYIDLRTLRSGIDRRDRDIYRTLNVENHPFAEFNGTLDTPFNANDNELQEVAATGEFTIHGVTREISVNGTLQMQGENLKLIVEWDLNLNDYEIEPPGILFYRVNEVQQIRIEALLEPRDKAELLDSE